MPEVWYFYFEFSFQILVTLCDFEIFTNINQFKYRNNSCFNVSQLNRFCFDMKQIPVKIKLLKVTFMVTVASVHGQLCQHYREGSTAVSTNKIVILFTFNYDACSYLTSKYINLLDICWTNIIYYFSPRRQDDGIYCRVHFCELCWTLCMHL